MIKVKYSSHYEDILSLDIQAPLYVKYNIQKNDNFMISNEHNNMHNNHIYIPKNYVSTSMKQALSNEGQEALQIEVEEHYYNCLELYNSIIAMGICKDQAKGVLPQSIIIGFTLTGSLNDFYALISNEISCPDTKITLDKIKNIIKNNT